MRQQAGLRGGFAFPLLFRGEINSIMELFSHNVVEPDEDFLQMVEAFGSQIGLFIERGRIELELQQEKEKARRRQTRQGIDSLGC